MTNEVDISNPILPSWAGNLWTMVNNFYDLRYGVLIGIACFVIGFALKSMKKFPNDGIPMVLIVLAALFSVLLQPDPPSGIPSKAWLTKNALCGLGVGGLTWLFHKAILKKVKDKFGVEIGTNGDSNPPIPGFSQFEKPAVEVKPEPPKV